MKNLFAVLTVAVLGAGLVGCGETKKPEPAAAPAETPAAPAEKPADAPAEKPAETPAAKPEGGSAN